MKKKLISLMTAAVLVLSMGTTVFAANSPTASDASNVTDNTTQKVQISDVQTKKAAEYLSEFKGATATMGGTAVNIIVSAVSDNTVAATAAEVKAQLSDVEKLANLLKSDSLKAAFADSTKKIVPTIKTIVDVTVEGRTVTAAATNATNTTNTTDVASPKTGMSASVVPVLALVLAAGAVVCARRVKR